MATCASLRGTRKAKLYVDTDAPATFDQSGWETWVAAATAVEGPSTIQGPFGGQRGVNEFRLLTDDIICKEPDLVNYGSITFNLYKIDSDAGQAVIAAGFASGDTLYWAIEFDDETATLTVPSRLFFSGFVTAYQQDEITGANKQGGPVTVEMQDFLEVARHAS